MKLFPARHELGDEMRMEEFQFYLYFLFFLKIITLNAVLLGSAYGKSLSANHQAISNGRAQGLVVRCSSCKTRKHCDALNLVTRRNAMGLLFGVPSILINSADANGAGLPPEEKPKLCDDACEKELENVWWDYIAPLSSMFSLSLDSYLTLSTL